MSIDHISKSNAISSDFVSFLPCDNDLGNPDTLQNLKIINQDALSLLQCDFDTFWSTVFYNNTLSWYLDSFLHHWKSKNVIGDPNCKDELYFANGAKTKIRPDEKMRKDLFMNMWRILYRISHPNEDKNHTISPENFSSILQTTKLFTTISLIDICNLYSHYHNKGTQKMMVFLFTSHRQFLHELGPILTQIESTLGQYAKNTIGVSIPSKTATPEEVETIGASLIDTVVFLESIATSLFAFFDCTPPEVSLLVADDHTKLLLQFVVIFELILPHITLLVDHYIVHQKRKKKTKLQLSTIANAIFALFTHVLTACFIVPLTKISKFEVYDQEGHARSFLSMLGEFDGITSKFKGTCKKVKLPTKQGQEKLLFLLDAELNLFGIVQSFSSYFQNIPVETIHATANLFSNRKVTKKNDQATFKVERIETPTGPSNQIVPAVGQSTGYSKSRMANIQSVKGILDFLGEGFINACLELYQDDVAIVCDRILSDNLAEPLLGLDRSMDLPQKNKQMHQAPKTKKKQKKGKAGRP